MKQVIFIMGIALFSCNEKTTAEDPVAVATLYCDCIHEKFTNAADSSVSLNDCEMKMISSSRLMRIYADFDNRGKYNAATLDSAMDFSMKVREIEDTLCYNKIDFKKVKKAPGIKL